MNDFINGTMRITPHVYDMYGYNRPAVPSLAINITAPQTDNRVVVTAGSMTQATVTLSEDRYATTEQYLMKALFQYEYGDDTIPVHVKLKDGKELDLQCRVHGYHITTTDPNMKYKGAAGTYTMNYDILLPVGYRAENGGSYYDLQLTQNIIITVDQNPRYDNVFVSDQPKKLAYKVGETLDLTGLMVMYKDTAQLETDSYIYVGADQLTASGLKLHWEYSSGPEVDLTAPLTKDRNGDYIYIVNPSNNSSFFFGPISVTE
jgi:hypothetical protein